MSIIALSISQLLHLLNRNCVEPMAISVDTRVHFLARVGGGRKTGSKRIRTQYRTRYGWLIVGGPERVVGLNVRASYGFELLVDDKSGAPWD